jgi:hypothetical protein
MESGAALRIIARSGKGNSMNTTTAERVTDADGTAFEGEIREFIRKDIAPTRRVSTESSEFAVNSVNSLVQRVAGTSLQEIDNLVVELQKLRDFLVSEGERVQREIAGYGELSKATLRSAKLIAETIPGRNFPPDAPRRD